MTTETPPDDLQPVPVKKAEAFMLGFEAPAEAERAWSPEPLGTYERAIAGGKAILEAELEKQSRSDLLILIQQAARVFLGEHDLLDDEPRTVSDLDFDCWKLFDMADELGTAGAHLESVARECRRKRWIDVLASLNASRYGFFTVLQREHTRTLRLRELFTKRTELYLVREGTFQPRKDQIIFTRVASPFRPEEDLGVGLTAPLQVRASPKELKAFFSRTCRRVGLPEAPDSYEALMKHGVGGDRAYWLRYIDRCIFHNTKEAEGALYFKEPPDRGLVAALEEVVEELETTLACVESLTPKDDFAAAALAPARAHAKHLDSTLSEIRDGLEEQWADRPEVADPMVRVLAAAAKHLNRMTETLQTD